MDKQQFISRIQDMTALKGTAPCVKCGVKLWNDHGWVLDDGSIVCRREDKCFSRVVATKLAKEKAAGILPPWRKAERKTP